MSLVLKAEKRENFGSSAAKKIKREGRIPAIIYAKDGSNTHLSIDTREFEREYFKGIALTSAVELEFGDKKVKAIAHKIELDPVSDHPVHIDFFPCEEGSVIRAKPKVIFSNKDKSPGLKRGGFLHVVARRVEVLCDNADSIPDQLEVDIASLHVGEKVRADKFSLPAGVKLAKKGNFLLASITGRGKSEETPAEAAASGEAAAATEADKPAEDKKEEEKK